MRCFKWRVVSGEWRVGKRLPSEPEAQATGFAHPTPDTQHLAPQVRALAFAALFAFALSIPYSLFPLPSSAQGPTYLLGRAPTAEEVRAWDTSVGVQGKELPPGSGSAKEGAPIYAKKCAGCHGPTGKEGPSRLLVGGQGTLKNLNPVKTIGSYYPFATTLWEQINRVMPENKEGSLSANEVYALTALLLYWNGIIGENDAMDAKSLPKVQMPNRNGFFPPFPPKYKPGEKKPFGQYP